MQENVAKNGWELTKVARIGRSPSLYGQKRVEGGVGQSREPKFGVCCLHTSAHPFLAKNRPGAPVFGYCPLNIISTSTAIMFAMFSCFFPATHPRNLDIRQPAESTNNIIATPSSTSSSGRHRDRVAGPRSTAMASCSIGVCGPSSVITASLYLSLLLCCACVRCVARLARAAKNKNMDLW